MFASLESKFPRYFLVPVAQWIERLPPKQQAARSSRAGDNYQTPDSHQGFLQLFAKKAHLLVNQFKKDSK
jgi:hypothetical protein